MKMYFVSHTLRCKFVCTTQHYCSTIGIIEIVLVIEKVIRKLSNNKRLMHDVHSYTYTAIHADIH